MTKKKIGPGGKLVRSEIIQARLDSKLRFAAEIIATKERRTLSSLVETALEQVIKNYTVTTMKNGVPTETKFMDLIDEIWSPNEMHRFLMIGFTHPDFYDTDKNDLWNFIYNKPYFWEHYEVVYKTRAGKVVKTIWQPYRNPRGVAIENLEKYWGDLQDDVMREVIYIPDEMGDKIKAPSEVKAEFIIDDEGSLPEEKHPAEVEFLQLLRDNVHKLIKYRKETVATAEGTKIVINPSYPTQCELEELVQGLYQDKFYGN